MAFDYRKTPGNSTSQTTIYRIPIGIYDTNNRIVLNKIIKSVNNILDHRQQVLLQQQSSTITRNLSFQNFILQPFSQNSQVGVIFTGFEKAFDRVDHEILFVTFQRVGFGGPLLSWFKLG